MQPSDPRILFGKRLATLRHERGLSQETLSHVSGLARSYLGEVERGHRNIALLNICRLAEALNVPASKLLEFSENDPRCLPGAKSVTSRP
ncbi:helix-turn-helix domain-containing protein [Thauera sp. WH-2]|uniref:helix-turn-helix domain-containing protein n=1 Tax=unclassified Thauera TaxID=2609274 RepID=UPI00353A8D81